MTETLGTEQVTALTLSMARLLAKNGHVDDGAIDLLLMASGMEGADAHEKLTRIGSILARAVAADESLQIIVIEALTLRGLPEGPATEAVRIVAGSGPEQSPSAASVPEQHPSPPVYRSSPEQRVETAGELVVAADGTGTHRTLEEAVLAAPSGATIRIGPGTHAISENLRLYRPITLLGAGFEETQIYGQAEYSTDPLIRYQGDGLFTMQDLLLAVPANAGDVVLVEGGEVLFERCRFARIPQDRETTSSGVYFQGDAQGTVQECYADNHYAGFFLRDEARVNFFKNVCIENWLAGIAFYGDSSGRVEGNACADNYGDGIRMGGGYQEIVWNRCQSNRGSGIICMGSGVAEGNQCIDNRAHGIVIENSFATDFRLGQNETQGNGGRDVWDQRR